MCECLCVFMCMFIWSSHIAVRRILFTGVHRMCMFGWRMFFMFVFGKLSIRRKNRNHRCQHGIDWCPLWHGVFGQHRPAGCHTADGSLLQVRVLLYVHSLCGLGYTDNMSGFSLRANRTLFEHNTCFFFKRIFDVLRIILCSIFLILIIWRQMPYGDD